MSGARLKQPDIQQASVRAAVAAHWSIYTHYTARKVEEWLLRALERVWSPSLGRKWLGKEVLVNSWSPWSPVHILNSDSQPI